MSPLASSSSRLFAVVLALIGGVTEAATFVEVASSTGVHSTLVAALQAASLDVALDDVASGPYTVFAPTDAAFAALPAGTVETLLGDVPALTNILLYHVLGGVAIESSSIVDGLSSDSPVAGETLSFSVNPVMVNGLAAVTTADVAYDNGIIHVIDTVLIPTSSPYFTSVVDVAVGSPTHTTLVAAVAAAGLVEALEAKGPFTLFAPTDDAFAALPEGTLESLLLPENKQVLTDILLYHVVGAKVTAGDIADGAMADTLLAENKLSFQKDSTGVTVNSYASVVAADITTDNGVVHVIDAVLLPPEEDATADAASATHKTTRLFFALAALASSFLLF